MWTQCSGFRFSSISSKEKFKERRKIQQICILICIKFRAMATAVVLLLLALICHPLHCAELVVRFDSGFRFDSGANCSLFRTRLEVNQFTINQLEINYVVLAPNSNSLICKWGGNWSRWLESGRFHHHTNQFPNEIINF